MGEAELQPEDHLLIIHAVIYFYGHASGADISKQIAKDIADHWNAPKGRVRIGRNFYDVFFDIEGIYEPDLSPGTIFENTCPRNNYFRLEEYAHGNISFVDGLGSNTGYFKLDNLLNNSTTAAHEFGHTLGLGHPKNLDIRGEGRPGIMYPRGTITDPQFQYDPGARPGAPGGTMDPFTRRVTQPDIGDLKLDRLGFYQNGSAVVGAFSSVWHDPQLP